MVVKGNFRTRINAEVQVYRKLAELRKAQDVQVRTHNRHVLEIKHKALESFYESASIKQLSGKIVATIEGRLDINNYSEALDRHPGKVLLSLMELKINKLITKAQETAFYQLLFKTGAHNLHERLLEEGWWGVHQNEHYYYVLKSFAIAIDALRLIDLESLKKHAEIFYSEIKTYCGSDKDRRTVATLIHSIANESEKYDNKVSFLFDYIKKHDGNAYEETLKLFAEDSKQ
jgi:hypothetical protein